MDGREQENTAVILQRENLSWFSLLSWFQKCCWIVPFHHQFFESWSFCSADILLSLFPTICVKAFWGLEYSWGFIPAGTKHFILTTAWRWCALTIKSYISHHPLNLPHPILFNSCTVPFAPLLCFHLYLYLDFCLLCAWEREEAIENHYKGIHNPSKELEWVGFMQYWWILLFMYI